MDRDCEDAMQQIVDPDFWGCTDGDELLCHQTIGDAVLDWLDGHATEQWPNELEVWAFDEIPSQETPDACKRRAEPVMVDLAKWITEEDPYLLEEPDVAEWVTAIRRGNQDPPDAGT